MPFLPGDSLLFVVGALCGAGLMNLPLSIGAAHRRGDPRQPEQLHDRPLLRAARCSSGRTRAASTSSAFDQAHAFYEKYGGITIVLARFMPFLRTFAPFVAGVAQMTRSKFTFYDVTGGALWVGSITLAGYLFGNIPWVQENLDKIIWAMILRARAWQLAWLRRSAGPGWAEERPDCRGWSVARERRALNDSRCVPPGARPFTGDVSSGAAAPARLAASRQAEPCSTSPHASCRVAAAASLKRSAA